MKNIVKIFVLLMIVALALSINVSAHRDYTYIAPYATPVVDGEIDEIWETSGAEWAIIDLPYDGIEWEECTARAKIMHDSTYLYVIAECTDTTLGSDNGDAFEIYFDEDNCHEYYYCFYSTQLQMFFDGQAQAGPSSYGTVDMVEEYAVNKVADDKIIVEMSLSLLNGIPAPDRVIGLEFMYNDADLEGNFQSALRWNVDTPSGEDAPYLSVEFLGDLICAAEGADLAEIKASVEQIKAEAAAATEIEPEPETEPETEEETEEETEAETEPETEAEEEEADADASISPDAAPEEEKSSTGLIVGIAVVAAIIVVGVIVIIIAKKKK